MSVSGWFKGNASGVIESLALSWRIFARTVGAKYRKSFLGYFWMVAPALLITAGVTLANRSGVISPGETRLPYPVFVFLGTVIWQLFAEAVDVPHQAFQSAASYLTRVAFPREAILLAQVYETLITATVRLLLALLLLSVVREVTFYAVVMIALCFSTAILLGFGLGAIVMPFTMLFADVHNTLKLILAYGLFLTPALYQPRGDGTFTKIVNWNPVAPLMHSAREAAAGIPIVHVNMLFIVLGVAVVMTVIGFAFVRLVAPIVIERMLLGGR